MRTLISKEEAIAIASGFCHPANIATELAKLPEAIVRCRDCKHWLNGFCVGLPINGDEATTLEMGADDYCSFGERREEE